MTGIIPILVFAGVASPAMFKLTSKILGKWVASQDGVATIPGLLLHGIVFVLIMTILRMFMVRSSGYLTEGGMKFMTRDDQDDQNNKHFQEDRFVYSVTV
jgi:hypothetical protein